MEIAFDDIVGHQPLNDIGRFTFRRANDLVMPQEVARIDEGVGTDAGVLAKIFEAIVGIERLHGNPVFLPIPGGMPPARLSPINFREFQRVQKLQDAIVGRRDVLEGKVPVDGRFACSFVNPFGNPCDLADANEAAIAKDTGEKRFF